ncbi:uncharacterized protein MCYG_06641 [Microsporum canis CBS 113480]|uniref:Uncharacterized protein n=1 Tax=Arthroderma otae (strain ATCC MYA-4605 / CBS 113480) TaxID=554155 RepID=C5FV88_ARTOC|nr:uncharacterized protein MCYG_06641 [Microsporum canis CBS 113480]EEQ33822.1 predicted protein [Microsporum canis CBS 113480]
MNVPPPNSFILVSHISETKCLISLYCSTVLKYPDFSQPCMFRYKLNVYSTKTNHKLRFNGRITWEAKTLAGL